MTGNNVLCTNLDREDGVNLPDEAESDALLREGVGKSSIAPIITLKIYTDMKCAMLQIESQKN